MTADSAATLSQADIFSDLALLSSSSSSSSSFLELGRSLLPPEQLASKHSQDDEARQLVRDYLALSRSAPAGGEASGADVDELQRRVAALQSNLESIGKKLDEARGSVAGPSEAPAQ